MQTVYLTGVNTTSATKADLVSSDILTGHIREEATTGKRYVLTKNGAVALIDGGACKLEVGQTTTAAQEAQVIATTSAILPTWCANNTGAVVPIAHYFWGIQQGRGYGIGGTIGDGVAFTAGAAGIIQGVGAATDQMCGITISDVTTTVVNAVFWGLPSSGPGA